MKSSPPGSVQKRVYNNSIPMDLIRDFLVVPEFDQTMKTLFKIFYSLVCYEKSVFDLICCQTGETKITYLDTLFENNLISIARMWHRLFEKNPEQFHMLR